MKIVVLDGYALNPGDLTWRNLNQYGQLTVYDRTPEDQVVKRVGDADIVMTNKTPVNQEVFEHCVNVKYVGVLATGYNIVDVKAAKEKGVIVSNIPTYGTDAVAQFAIALLLEVCHHVGEHSNAVKNGEWTNNPDWSFWKYPLIELAGKTLGVIGFGRIGKKMAQIAQALGMNVIALATHTDKDLESDTLSYGSLEVLLSKSDVISLHCPLTPSTEGIINAENIGKIKDGVIIINTSRGPLIIEEDLCNALNSGKVAYAACDVCSSEPIKESNPLLSAKNILITPHIAWAPIEARMRLMDLAVNNLEAYLEGNPINTVSG